MLFLNCPNGDNIFPVYESTSNVVYNDEVIIVGVPGACANGSAYVLSDDDNLQVLPHYPSGGALIGPAFAAAYISPQYLGAAFQDTVEFNMHLSDAELLTGYGWNDGRDVQSSARFWSCLVVGCWEGPQDFDADPDYCFALPPPPFVPRPGAEVGEFGATVTSWGESAIYLQTIADPCSQSTDEAHTVVHEIGHTPGYPNHVPNSIMEAGAPATENSFAPETIAYFRSRVTW